MSVRRAVRESLPTDVVTSRRAGFVGLTLVVGGSAVAYFARRPDGVESDGGQILSEADDMRRRDELMKRINMSRVGRRRRDRRKLDHERMRQLYEFELRQAPSRPRAPYDELFANPK
jgi:hypothetical protein